MPKSKSKTFEENLTRLEEVVKLLEDGSVPLEESMKLFQEGSDLAASCGKLLDRAELEIVKLTRDSDGSLKEVPFADESAT